MRRALPSGLLVVCLSSLLGAAGGGLSAQRAYQIGPTPVWVKPRQADLNAPSLATEGWESLLTDRQESVGGGPSGIERYWHSVYRVLDEGGVKDNSQIEIVFDSTYQQLILHSVRVRRGGRSIDQLKPAQIHVAQRETQLEYQIFDGSLSVVILLEDVRRGDVIEYSFTRRGSNPVFRGHFMSQFRVQEDVPMHQQYFRLVWQRDRPPHIRALHTEVQPIVTTTGSTRQYEWSRLNVPALAVEKNVPDWYDPYPTVQVSDFGSWRDVAAWGDSLFPDGELPPSLRDFVARIRASTESPESRTIQALRFVQDEIRYTGVEIGANSHMPYSPAVVARRRYGDCKDKTLLLITMLRALGVTARPALVSTTYREHVGAFHPTAVAFDHAIVQAELNGQTHWIDPSALYQRGDLRNVAASYGAALVLGGPSDSLVPIPEPRPAEPTTDIVVSFDIGAVEEPTTMRVETRYSGRTANAFRSSISGSSRKELQQSYAEYYSKLYPGIRSVEPPAIDDDETANVVRATERYTIADFWAGDSAEGRVGKFEPLELSSAVPIATATERRMPLAVSYPMHIRYIITAHVKEGWSVRRRDEHIETDAARFSYEAGASGKVLTLSYEYETIADHVMPGAANAHIKDMARAGEMLVYRVTPPGSGTQEPESWQPNWSVFFAALFAAALACMLALRLSRANLALPGGQVAPVPVPGTTRRDEPVGLGGWLVLAGIGVTVAPVQILITLFDTLHTYGLSSWTSLTTPGGSNYHALWAPVLMFELIGNITLLVFAGLLVWLFYMRKRQFPTVFIWVAVGRLVFTFADTALAGLVPVTDPKPVNWNQLFTILLATVLWIAYMRRSRRVRNTFVS